MSESASRHPGDLKPGDQVEFDVEEFDPLYPDDVWPSTLCGTLVRSWNDFGYLYCEVEVGGKVRNVATGRLRLREVAS